jgi:hypothetical protein
VRRVLARGPNSGRVSRVAFFLIVAARDERRRGARATLFSPIDDVFGRAANAIR